jgi:hypothetical protein
MLHLGRYGTLRYFFATYSVPFFTQISGYRTVPEFIDPVSTKTSPKRSFSLNRKRAFWLVFAKTGPIISGTGTVETLLNFADFDFLKITYQGILFLKTAVPTQMETRLEIIIGYLLMGVISSRTYDKTWCNLKCFLERQNGK